MLLAASLFSFFFFNDTATTEIYTLSLHDALPISRRALKDVAVPGLESHLEGPTALVLAGDRKSTRLNSSHLVISYAVFCLKKKKKLTTVSNVSRPYNELSFAKRVAQPRLKSPSAD